MSDFVVRLLTASHRYDAPKVRTIHLLDAIKTAIGLNVPLDCAHAVDILDVIREMIPNPSLRDAKIAAFLIGHDYDPKDIQYACAYHRMSSETNLCLAVRAEHREALAQLLEKP
jgi:hypothetical protein